MRVEIPAEQLHWDARCRHARMRLEIATDAVVSATHPSEMPGLLGKLHAAKEEFGRALLALDKRRRPELYQRRYARR